MADETGQGGYTDGGEEREHAYSKAPKLKPGEAKTLKARFACGNRYYEQCFEKQVTRCRELYDGDHWVSGTRKRKCNPVINYSKFIVDTMAAALAHNPGDVDLKPEDELGDANLEVSRRALKWGEKVSNAHREAKRTLRECGAYSLGVAYTFWKYEEAQTPPAEGRPAEPGPDEVLAAVERGEPMPGSAPPSPAPISAPIVDQPCVRRLDARLFRISPEADWVIDDAEWCGFVEFRALDEVKADPRFRKGITRKLKGSSKTLKAYLSPEERGKEDAELTSDVKRVELWHYFEKRRKLHIVFAEECPDYLMYREWDWQFEGYPFSALFTPRLEDEFYTKRPPLIQTEHQQQEINEAAGQLATHRRRANRVFITAPEAFSKNAEKALEAGEDGAVIHTKGGLEPSRALFVPQFPQLQPEVYNSRDIALQDMRSLHGVNQYEQGMAPTKRMTQAEVAAVQAAGGALQKEMQQRYEAFYADILSKVFALMQQYADRTRELPIYDPNEPEKIIGWGPWSKEQIQGKYHFSVVVGSTMQGHISGQVEEKGFLLQSLQPYAQAGQINSQPLIKQLLRAMPEIRDVDEIVSPQPMLPPGMPGQPPEGGDASGGAPAMLPGPGPMEGPGGGMAPIPDELLMQFLGQGGG